MTTKKKKKKTRGRNVMSHLMEDMLHITVLDDSDSDSETVINISSENRGFLLAVQDMLSFLGVACYQAFPETWGDYGAEHSPAQVIEKKRKSHAAKK